jgi:RsiW-degrading membrane proteinase PrsW (M82 family)
VVGFFIEPWIGNTFHSNALISGFVSAFLLAAIPEEFFKFVFLKSYIFSEECDEPYDFVFYGAMVSVGFAAIENVFFVLDGGLIVAIGRAFTAVPMHAVCGAMMGYGLLQSIKFASGKNFFTWEIIKGTLFIPIVFHGLYDWPIFVAYHEGISDILVIISCVFWLGVMFFFLKIFIKMMKGIQQKSQG